MVKGALFKKSVQDMKKSRSQFISIFIMAAVAMSIAAGLDSIWKTIETQSNVMYRESNLSDLWAAVANPSETQLWKVRNIDGVAKAEKRFTVNSIAQVNGNPTLKVYAMPTENTLDLPDVESGKKLSRQGAILDESFASAHHLAIGDTVTIEINEKKIKFTIDALALSSEHIFAVKDTSTLLPDPQKYGFIVVDEDRIASTYGGFKPYNQVALRLDSGADSKAVQKQIDSIFGDSLIGVITRNDNRSIKMVDGKVQQFKTLATVFPIMFFLVTALITLSTMTRLVEDQRNQIGVLKALGYNRQSILWHYTSYGVYVGLLGSLAGIVIGPNVIGRALLSKFRFLLTMQSYDMSLDIPNIILRTILILLCTGGISCYSCLKLQNEMPAVLLRDKPPKKGIHVFLERLPKIWNSMKFSSKLIVRNTVRNKGRMVMCILGVMGCTGLIIGAFTLYDMVTGVSKTTYEKIYAYDQKITLDSKTTARDIKNLNLDGIVQDLEENSAQLTADNGIRKLAPVTVFSKGSPLINLQDADGNKVTLPDQGIAITRKLAELMSVKTGDTINFKRSDDSYVPLKIEKIVYMVSGQGIYMTDGFWEEIGEDYRPNALLVKWHRKDESFLNSDYVESSMDRITQQQSFNQNLTAVLSAAFMLVLAGGILAFVVLYNMGVLNFFERVRDLATLEVLGFHQKEIKPLVLMENILSAVIGIVFGIPVGMAITYIMQSGFGDDLDLIGHVTPDKVLLAGVLTLVFSGVVSSVVTKKIKTIDMLQALKSVE